MEQRGALASELQESISLVSCSGLQSPGGRVSHDSGMHVPNSERSAPLDGRSSGLTFPAQ